MAAHESDVQPSHGRRQSQTFDQADVEPRGKEARAGNRDQMRDRLRPDRGQFQRSRGGRLGQRQRLFRIALHPQGGCRTAIRRPRRWRIERLSRPATVAGFQEHAAATPDLGTLKQGGQKPGLAPVGQKCSCNPRRRPTARSTAPVPRWPAPRSSCSSGAPPPDIRTWRIDSPHQRRSQARKPAEQSNDRVPKSKLRRIQIAA